MSFTRLWDAGYTPLVSVTRPGATVHPRSDLRAEDLGKAPGKPARDGRGWWGYDWRGEPPSSRAQLEAWEETGANVGINAALYPGLDIDVMDATLARVVLKYAREQLGPAPVRLSRDPRRLLVYRAAEEFGRMHLKVQLKDGTWHLVEMLASGQQYLVHGRHPKGMDYRWEGPALWDTAPDALTPITRADAERFFNTLASALAAAGLKVQQGGDGSIREHSTPQDLLRAPELEMVRGVVEQIPNPAELGWHDMVRMGHAIRAACGEENDGEAQALFDDWCDRWEGDSTGERARWESMAPPHAVGWNWLQEQAAATGLYNGGQDDFEADPNAGPPPPTLTRPLTVEERAAASGLPTDDPSLQPGVEFSDEWVIDQLVPEARQRLRYIRGQSETQGTWYIWKGHHWEADIVMVYEGVIREMLRRLAVRVHEIGQAAPSAKEAKPFHQMALRLQSGDGLSTYTRMLRQRVSTHQTLFDTDPMLLCTPGGVVDLRTGEIREAVPEAMHSRTTLVAPVRGKTKLWDRFLADVTGRDAEYTTYLQRLLGYCLTGQMSEKVMAYAWGAHSDTGKSTLVKVVMQILGSYADSVDVETFISDGKTRDNGADLARLPGARLVTATEPEAGKKWNEKRIKSITGGDAINCRFLYGQWFNYTPQFKLLIVGNHEPEIEHVEEAMMRRIRILPMNRRVARGDQIENLAERLVEEEGGAILQWMLDGCLAWQRDGLKTPDVVTQAIGDYWDEQDTLSTWFAEACVVEPGAMVHRQDLYESYATECRRRDQKPCGANAFRALFRPIADRNGLWDGEVDINGSRRKGYRGARLKPRVALGTDDFGALHG